MNLLLLFPEDRRGEDRFEVTGARAAHLADALEVTPGRRVHVGLLDGPRGLAEITSVAAGRVTLRAGPLEAGPPRGEGRLLLAVPRRKVLKRLLPQLAALGLDELVLFRSWRVDRGDLESELLDPAGFRPLLHEGLMQACLTHEPRVRVERRFRPWVEDRLPGERPEETRVVAHPRAPRPLLELPLGVSAWALAVGPERGLLDEEVEALRRARFLPARVAPGILKVETACVVGLGVLGAAAEARRPESE